MTETLNRAAESSTKTGAGATVVLGGALVGRSTFAVAAALQGLSAGASIYAVVETEDGAVWEAGIYTLGVGEIVRTSILATSLGNTTAVDFPAGPKRVVSSRAAQKDSNIPLSSLALAPAAGLVLATAAGEQLKVGTPAEARGILRASQVPEPFQDSPSDSAVSYGIPCKNLIMSGSVNIAKGAGDLEGMAFEAYRRIRLRAVQMVVAVAAGAGEKARLGIYNATVDRAAIGRVNIGTLRTDFGQIPIDAPSAESIVIDEIIEEGELFFVGHTSVAAWTYLSVSCQIPQGRLVTGVTTSVSRMRSPLRTRAALGVGDTLPPGPIGPPVSSVNTNGATAIVFSPFLFLWEDA